MPHSNSAEIIINGESVEFEETEKIPLSITYELEDKDDFRHKKTSYSLNITIPATRASGRVFNSIYNPSFVELRPSGKGYNSDFDVIIKASGNELLNGKGFITSASRIEKKPNEFTFDCYGDSASWIIENKELTLKSVVSNIPHDFREEIIKGSWNHDGTDENRDYVYAPFRGRQAFGNPLIGDIPDAVFRLQNARPSLFVYWLVYRGFKRAGYRLVSEFMDTEYFRRLVLVWTFGNLFYIDDVHFERRRFVATGQFPPARYGGGGVWYGSAFICRTDVGDPTNTGVLWLDGVGNPKMIYELANTSTGVGLLNIAGSYAHNNATGRSTWTYDSSMAGLGTITVGFEFKCWVQNYVSSGSHSRCWIYVYKNGVFYDMKWITNETAPLIGDAGFLDYVTINFEVEGLNPTDTVSIEVHTDQNKTALGIIEFQLVITGQNILVGRGGARADINGYWKLTYIKRQEGSIIDLSTFEGFEKHKWLDLLRGLIDTFNLQISTDNRNKTVTIEPTHPYSLDQNLKPSYEGFYNRVLDWTDKQDISKGDTVTILIDNERLFDMRFKQDEKDGIAKKLRDRLNAPIGNARFEFSERFKKGEQNAENRFFSSVVHYNHDEWKGYTGQSPQLICLIPENVSNTSNPESESEFAPKLAYYKGLVGDYGWNFEEDTRLKFPFMFAVNYKLGGDRDPILSYSNELIGELIYRDVGIGLMQRFFLKRFAITERGVELTTSMKLNNTDVINASERTIKTIDGQRYELRKINSYEPLKDESTECILVQDYPVTEDAKNKIYPSTGSVLYDTRINENDLKYNRALVLTTDITNK